MTINNIPRCILLVDDDPDDIFLHQIVIKESGLSSKVIEAENGEVAWNYFTKSANADFQKPEIIFLDINMPRIDGFEFLTLYITLCEEFRRDIKVAILSTSSNPWDQEKASAILPGIQYLTKPLTQEMLVSIINQTSFLSNVEG